MGVSEQASIIKVEAHGNYVVGRVVSNTVSQREAPIIEHALSEAGPGARWRVIVDLRDVALLSSVGLGMLITMHKRCSEGRGKVAVCNLSKELIELIKMTKLDRVFAVADTLDDAIAKVGAA